MKRMRVFMTIVAALAILTTIAGPAAATVRVGAFAGAASVGKFIDHCNHDGTGTVSGAGLGLPLPGMPKNAYYQLSAVVHVLSSPGKSNAGLQLNLPLDVCGRLGPVGKAPVQLGAACGMSKGYAGKGRLGGGTPSEYSLHDITWKTPGAVIPFYASGQEGEIAKGASGEDLVVGLIWAAGGMACLTKHFDPITGLPRDKDDTNSMHGATVFTVVGVFAVLNDMYVDPQQDNRTPAICKKTHDPLCAYKDKKPQPPKEDG